MQFESMKIYFILHRITIYGAEITFLRIQYFGSASKNEKITKQLTLKIFSLSIK